MLRVELRLSRAPTLQVRHLLVLRSIALDEKVVVVIAGLDGVLAIEFDEGDGFGHGLKRKNGLVV